MRHSSLCGHCRLNEFAAAISAVLLATAATNDEVKAPLRGILDLLPHYDEQPS
jgi:hypothetical protein